MKALLRTVLPRTAGAVVLGAGAGVLAASFALQGSAGLGWVLLGGIGTALSVALVPITIRVLAVHHVTAFGLPGIKLPSAPPAWVPGVLAGASLLGTANPASATARSRTNSGTTSRAPSRAARSGGWSCSRRSEVNRTTETFMDGLRGGGDGSGARGRTDQVLMDITSSGRALPDAPGARRRAFG